MAQRSRVPRFGNWDSEENVPYTAYFDKARKDRTGTKMINPNDPEENPDLFSDNSSSYGAPPSTAKAELVEQTKRERVGSTHEKGRSGGGNSGETHRRATRYENSIERSPLHRHAKVSGRDSPSLEGKGSYEGSHGTPGRTRGRTVARGDETPDRSAAVPKFGAWDENNPSSADGFTHIFNQVREERQSEAGRLPGSSTPPSYTNARKQYPDKNSKSCCCFPWSKK